MRWSLVALALCATALAQKPMGGGGGGGGSTSPGGTNGQVQYNNNGVFGGLTLSGDCTLVASTGVITCAKYDSFNVIPSTTMTGLEVIVATLANVPALPAGSCYSILSGFNGPTALNVKIKVDGTTISNPWNATAANVIETMAFYCNNAGVQSAQTFYYPVAVSYWSGATTFGAVTAPQGTDTQRFTPAAVDWSTTHTLTITATQASGTITGYFHVRR